MKHWWKYLLAVVLIVVLNDAVCILLGPRRRQLVPDADKQALTACLPEDICHGNSIHSFFDFESMVADLVPSIDSARISISIAFFHYDDDSVGNRVADHLIERAKAGVQVRFMYDGEQFRRLPIYNKMEKAGIRMCRFNTIYVPWLTRNDLVRNHQKIVVIDGCRSYTGGMNIADRYSSGIDGRPWVDMFFRLDGPVSAAMEEIFAESWQNETGERIEPCRGHLSNEGLPLEEVGILASGAIGEGPKILEHYCELLDSAARYAYFESPYFIPPAPLMEAMKGAAARGVDVRVIYPDKCDLGSPLDYCSDSFVAEALSAGIKVGQYAPGFLHAKLFVTDDISCIGSVNIDHCSLCTYLEMMVFVHDPVFTEHLVRHFHEDEACVTYLDASSWEERPLSSRLGERTWRLMRAVL